MDESPFIIGMKLFRQSTGLYNLRATVVVPAGDCRVALRPTLGGFFGQPLPANAIGVVLPMRYVETCANPGRPITYQLTNLKLGGRTRKTQVKAFLVLQPGRTYLTSATIDLAGNGPSKAPEAPPRPKVFLPWTTPSWLVRE